MSLQDFFPKTLVNIENKGNEYVTFSRAARSNTIKSINTISSALLQNNTVIENGDKLTTDNEIYFVAAIRRTFINTVCQVHKTNCEITVSRLVAKYVNGNKVGTEEKTISVVPSIQTTVTARMKEFDAGLLSNTVRKFLFQKQDIKELDRIRMGDSVYQVDDIDESSYEGLVYVQCSVDKRK